MGQNFALNQQDCFDCRVSFGLSTLRVETLRRLRSKTGLLIKVLRWTAHLLTFLWGLPLPKNKFTPGPIFRDVTGEKTIVTSGDRLL